MGGPPQARAERCAHSVREDEHARRSALPSDNSRTPHNSRARFLLASLSRASALALTSRRWSTLCWVRRRAKPMAEPFATGERLEHVDRAPFAAFVAPLNRPALGVAAL